jgi:hypothetical protein
MSEPAFRFVSAPSALIGAPAGWAAEMLREGEVALLAVDGLDAVNQVAHDLGLASIQIIRAEADAGAQDQTVITHATSLPLIWVAPAFSEPAESWARQRGPMTLLVESGEPLADDERRRIDRFVASLGRQSE